MVVALLAVLLDALVVMMLVDADGDCDASWVVGNTVMAAMLVVVLMVVKTMAGMMIAVILLLEMETFCR